MPGNSRSISFYGIREEKEGVVLEIGSLVDGKYRILSKCGQGGMSVVYMARNERANRIWAIKEVRRDGILDFESVKRGLSAETDLLKRMSHPNLPGIVDVIDSEDSFLIVMDFIEGKTLSDVLKENGPQPQERVIDWAKQLCDVLGYLHSRTPPIVYRDMKPSNIMLKPDGKVVLFDFGTAREYKALSKEDTVCLGTRGYAAPEQYGGQGQTDARTDIYCLGATMYHLLTGHNPGEPPYEMCPIRQWNPDFSSGLEAILQKCTQNNPEDRYQSCAQLFYALDHYWEADAKYRSQQISKFRKFMAAISAAVLLGLGAAAFWGAERYTINSSYEAYISAARNAVSKTDEIANYRKAINLEPSRSEAYISLLKDCFLSDGKMTSGESEQLRAALIDYGNGRTTNETEFKKNKEGYDRFAYEAGIAYFYKFEEEGNKKFARGYFEWAAKSIYLKNAQVERAKRLYTIADYYSKIGKEDETGDAPVTCLDYWRDLTELSSGNLVEADNEMTALIMYQELASQIAFRCAEFKKDGIEKYQMEEQIMNIRSHLQTDFENVNEGSRTAVAEKIQQVKKTLERAENSITAAYGNAGQEV